MAAKQNRILAMNKPTYRPGEFYALNRPDGFDLYMGDAAGNARSLQPKTSITGGGQLSCYTTEDWVTYSHHQNANLDYLKSRKSGTGTTPNVEWKDLGHLITPGTSIANFAFTGYCNSTEPTDFELYLVLRSATAGWSDGIAADVDFTNAVVYTGLFWANVDTGQPAFTGALTETHGRLFTFDPVSVDDLSYLSLYARPIPATGITADRLFYSSYSIGIV